MTGAETPSNSVTCSCGGRDAGEQAELGQSLPLTPQWWCFPREPSDHSVCPPLQVPDHPRFHSSTAGQSCPEPLSGHSLSPRVRTRSAPVRKEAPPCVIWAPSYHIHCSWAVARSAGCLPSGRKLSRTCKPVMVGHSCSHSS